VPRERITPHTISPTQCKTRTTTSSNKGITSTQTAMKSIARRTRNPAMCLMAPQQNVVMTRTVSANTTAAHALAMVVLLSGCRNL